MRFEEIYRQHQGKIYRLCLGYTNDEDWAKDLVQETFIQVHLHLHRFRNESTIGTWVYRIAVNICLRQLEKANRQKKANTELQEFNEEEKEGRNLLTRLYDAIVQLDQTDRLIITLVLEDVKNADIAKILGITEGNVRVKVHRIKKQLSKILK